jgi:2'-hydroxyisoflavone reductase
MKVLVLGGTRFVGRHIVEALLARGHTVTLVHRGKSGPAVFPASEHLMADRNEDLSVLDGREFDATVDVCAYFPRQVSSLADALGGRGGRYVFVSTTSVYDTDRTQMHGEDAGLAVLEDPTTEEVTDVSYGGLKVLCEGVARDRFGDSLTVVRPTYVVGPHDYTHRFTYWVERIAAGGEVLAPEPRDGLIQVIDARDMGEWIVRLIEQDVSGTFHAVSPPPPFTFQQMLEGINDAVGADDTTLIWVATDFLLAEGVDGNALPLWGEGGTDEGENADPSRAYGAGLAPRPFAQTVREVFAAEQLEPSPNLYGGGLSAEQEADLLRRWKES